MGKIKWQLLVTREVSFLERYLRVMGYARRFFPLTRAKAKNFLSLGEKGLVKVYDDPVASLWRRKIIQHDFSEKNAIIKFGRYFNAVFQRLIQNQKRLVRTKDSDIYYKFVDNYLYSRAIIFYCRELAVVALKEKDRKLARWAGGWQHKAEEISCRAWDNLKPFFVFIGRRKSVPPRHLAYYTPGEFEKLLVKGEKIKASTIKARQRKYGLILLNNKISLLTGRALDEFTGKNVPKVKIRAREVITGRGAYSGFIRGRVRLVFTEVQAAKMKKGEVLVTPMTTPRMSQAIKLARAFVTDEGGLTCHAAIISRELKIPCVIGTKIATQVLKDGDLVEVDANKGIVKKL